MPLPKLNLRDLFWLVVVVAMGLGWWVDRCQIHYRYDDHIRRHYNWKHMGYYGSIGDLFKPHGEREQWFHGSDGPPTDDE